MLSVVQAKVKRGRPPPEEMEAFFSAAESSITRRFAARSMNGSTLQKLTS